jgi:hypothetical protein
MTIMLGNNGRRRGQTVNWRSELLYEYFWERNYPQTPTILFSRTGFTR